MIGSERGQNRVYRQLYRDAHGPGPYTCSYCKRTMAELEVVHHADEDPSNNAIENLEAMHSECHNRHHHLGLTHEDEIKQQISDSLRAAYADGRRSRPDLSGERNPFFGRKHSDETKARISAARRRSS